MAGLGEGEEERERRRGGIGVLEGVEEINNLMGGAAAIASPGSHRMLPTADRARSPRELALRLDTTPVQTHVVLAALCCSPTPQSIPRRPASPPMPAPITSFALLPCHSCRVS